MLRRFLYLAVLALVAFAGDAKKTGNVLTTNDKQAAQLQVRAPPFQVLRSKGSVRCVGGGQAGAR